MLKKLDSCRGIWFALLCGLTLLYCLRFAATGRGEEAEIKVPIPDFTLTERSGNRVSREDLLGKVWLASFVLVRCPDGKCPQVTQTMEKLQERLHLAKRKDLLLVTFTIPDEDDAGALARYAQAFNADSEKWLFLTGSEDTIDELMRSTYLRYGQDAKKNKQHALRIMIVDKEGNMRGSFAGLKPNTGDTEADEEFFADDLKHLEQKVKQLTAPEIPNFLPRDIPRFNALLNATSAALLVLGFISIKKHWIRLHITCMLSAVVVSAVFLSSYLYFHLVIKQGQPTYFAEQCPTAPAWVARLYYGILLSHTILAIPAAPMAIISTFLGLFDRLRAHRRLATWTFPIWLYVSVTGVVVYWMLYRMFPTL